MKGASNLLLTLMVLLLVAGHTVQAQVPPLTITTTSPLPSGTPGPGSRWGDATPARRTSGLPARAPRLRGKPPDALEVSRRLSSPDPKLITEGREYENIHPR